MYIGSTDHPHIRIFGRANAGDARHAQLADLLGGRHRARHLQIDRLLAGIATVNERKRTARRKTCALHAAHIGHAGNLEGAGQLGANLGGIASTAILPQMSRSKSSSSASIPHLRA